MIIKVLGAALGLLLAGGLAAGCNEATTSLDHPAPPTTDMSTHSPATPTNRLPSGGSYYPGP